MEAEEGHQGMAESGADSAGATVPPPGEQTAVARAVLEDDARADVEDAESSVLMLIVSAAVRIARCQHLLSHNLCDSNTAARVCPRRGH